MDKSKAELDRRLSGLEIKLDRLIELINSNIILMGRMATDMDLKREALERNKKLMESAKKALK